MRGAACGKVGRFAGGNVLSILRRKARLVQTLLSPRALAHFPSSEAMEHFEPFIHIYCAHETRDVWLRLSWVRLSDTDAGRVKYRGSKEAANMV